MNSPRPVLTPTPEQEAIVAETAHGADSMLIQAYAGCAKTTTLEMLSKKIKVPGLALAFNKSIKMEMGRRFPGNFSVQTMNGLGHASIQRALPNVNLQLDDRKLGKLITEVAKEWKMEISGDQWETCRRYATAVMQAGVVPGGEGRPLLEDIPENWQAIADQEGVDSDEQDLLMELAREVIERNLALAKQGTISFDDQIWVSTCVLGKFPQFPILLVDEAQDLSPLNHRMLTLASRPDARLVVCGDEKQAIYAFRGADSESIGKIARLRQTWSRLPLATTFRCPKKIVARQQDHAPGFVAWHTNADGRHGVLGTEDEGWNERSLLEALPSPGATLAILCRNNGPLVGLAFKLISRGVPVEMLGRDLGKGLMALTRKLFPEDNTPVGICLGRTQEWMEHEVGLARANKREDKVDQIEDKADCLRALAAGDGVDCAKDIRRAIGRVFAPAEGTSRLTLSSIHKAKGLEWDVVLHLDPWRIPSKWAKRDAKNGDERQLVQEMNLKYVCETRTKHTLLEANLEDFE